MLSFPCRPELTLFRRTDTAIPAASRDSSAASPDCDDDFFQARAREGVGARSGGGVEEPAFDIGGRGGGTGAAAFHGDLQRLHLELAPRRGELGGTIDAAGDLAVEERIRQGPRASGRRGA